MQSDTHVVTTNGDSHMFLGDQVRPYPDQISRVLHLMDGERRWGYSLWRAPEGVGLFAIDKKKYPQNYMQSAGTAAAMTIEARFVGDDGVARHYAVGRPTEKNFEGEPSVVLRYLNGARELHVFPNEVFDAEEAAKVYYDYFLTDTVPQPYVLRRLDFSKYERERPDNDLRTVAAS